MEEDGEQIPETERATQQGQQCLGELHYVSNHRAQRGDEDRCKGTGNLHNGGLISFTPFKEEEEEGEVPEASQDLSYLDDSRLCMSPRDHEIDPEVEGNEGMQASLVSSAESRRFHSGAQKTSTTSAHVTLVQTKSTGLKVTKLRHLSSKGGEEDGPVLGKIVFKNTPREIVADAVSKFSNVQNCVVELCKRSDCGVDCKCFGRPPPSMRRKVVSSAAPKVPKTPEIDTRRNADGKRQMKMSEKLRAFYEERHKNRLAQTKKANLDSDPSGPKILAAVSLKSSLSSPNTDNAPKPNRRIRKSRRLTDSLYCPICSNEFHYIFSLRRHIKAHALKGQTILPPKLVREEQVVSPSKPTSSEQLGSQPDSTELYEEDEGPPHLDPEIPTGTPYSHIRALLNNNQPEPEPPLPKPARVVLNVPKIDFSRRQKALAREKVSLKQVEEETQWRPIGETDINQDENIINVRPDNTNMVTPRVEETEGRETGNTGEDVSTMGHDANYTNYIHPLCNPVVVIAPIDDACIPPVIDTPETQMSSSELPSNVINIEPIEEVEVSVPEPANMRMDVENHSIISTLDKATDEIFSILSQAENSADKPAPLIVAVEITEVDEPLIQEAGPTEKDTNTSPVDDLEEEDEDDSDPLNDSGVTTGDAEILLSDGEEERDRRGTRAVRNTRNKRGSSASLGLSSRGKMRNARLKRKRIASRQQQLSKSIKAIVNARKIKSMNLNSASSYLSPANERKSRKRKAPISIRPRSKDATPNEAKRQRTDSDSGIDTESDGSDRAKRSPPAKPISNQGEEETSEEGVVIHLMSGEPISKQELHAQIDDQIAKRTQSEPVVCPICEKKFCYPSEIKRHVMMHTNERAFKCALCDKAFARRPHLNEHMRVHTGERPFKCKSCPAAFAQKSNLIIHNRTHTGARPFACSECGKRFRRQDAQTQHLLTHHSNVKPYTCAECGAAFPCIRYLKDHMKCHSKERPFKCQQCEAAFVCNKYLKLHIRALHTNVRPYKCDMCPAKFTQSGKLVEHQRIHTGERPYSCSSCGAAFVRSGHLRRHLLTHTGERPYGCTECPAKFSQKDHLKRHIRSMHESNA